MSFVLPEVAVQRILQKGIRELRNNPDAFNEIFGQFLDDEMQPDYGQQYIDKIRKWFFENRVPVLQAWLLNPQRIPCYSIHLANEQEDESKAAIGDFYGNAEDGTITTGVFTVYVDIGIHANKDTDAALWLYYILSYVLFKKKIEAEQLGLRLHTWQASDHQKMDQKLGENIWTRWVRFRCVTQNWLTGEEFTEVEDVETNLVPEAIGDGNDDDLS